MTRIWWLPLLTGSCLFLDEVPCGTDLECEDAFGAGATCEVGTCTLPGSAPPGCTAAGGVVEVDEDVVTDTAWPCPDLRYVVDGTLRVTGRLEIGAGVTVEMGPGASIVVTDGGELDIAGAPARPVTLRSPDPVVAGDWIGVLVDESAGPVSIAHARLLGAGGGGGARFGDERAAITVFGTASITDTVVAESAAYGIRFARDGRPELFETNTFTRTALAPIRLDANDVDRLGNAHTFDPDTEIEVDATVVNHSATWGSHGVPYRLVTLGFDEGLKVGAPGGEPAILTLEAGVELRVENGTGIFVGVIGPGGLLARGTPREPVLFTTASFDPLPVAWSTLQFGPLTVPNGAVLEHAIVEYGGDGEYGGIQVAPSDATAILDAVTVRKAFQTGIVVEGEGADAVITDCVLQYNLGDGLSSGDSATVVVDGCLVADNGDDGISVRYGSDPSQITNCTFGYNPGGAMLVATEDLGIIGLGHVGTDPTAVVVWDEDGETVLEFDLALTDVGLPYQARVPVTVGGADLDTTLWLKPGVRMEFAEDARLDVPGMLLVTGSSTDPVVLSGVAGSPWPGLFVDPTDVTSDPGGLVINDALGGYEP